MSRYDDLSWYGRVANLSQQNGWWNNQLMNQPRHLRRNIMIFVIGVLSLAMAGGLITNTGQEAGGLVFILGPILMMVLLRSLGGDGWHDAGLRVDLRSKWRWYVFAVLAYPVTIGLVLALGSAIGVTSLSLNISAFVPALLFGVLSQLIPRLLLAACEELGWRGYLEPRLAAAGFADLPRHLLVGVVWASWHIPLILTTDYTDLDHEVFFPLFAVGVITTALVYGQLRKASGSVWTSVLMHGVGNAVAWALIQNNMVVINNKVLANIAPESVFMFLLWGGIAWTLFNREWLFKREAVRG